MTPEPQDLWCQTLRTHDLDEFARAQQSWQLHYEPLAAGRFEGELQQVQLPGLRVVHERANIALWQRGSLGEGRIGLAMPLELRGHGSYDGQPLTPDSIMVGRIDTLDLCLPAGAGLVAIVVEESLLARLWESLYHRPLSAWMQRHGVVEARPGLAALLRARHLQALAGWAAQPPALQPLDQVKRQRDALLVEWVEALPTRVEPDAARSRLARKRVVDRAVQLLRSCPEQPLSLPQVCDRLGVSPRKLGYCFQSVLGLSPARYWRTVRLDAVRRELLRDPSGAVQDVASRWGFWHMGEFAAAYRRQFGELPSQTRPAKGRYA